MSLLVTNCYPVLCKNLFSLDIQGISAQKMQHVLKKYYLTALNCLLLKKG